MAPALGAAGGGATGLLCLAALGTLAAVPWLLLLLLRFLTRRARAASPLQRALAGRETVGFFHPYAHAGGGGERVLWCAIRAIQRMHPGLHSVVYTGDVGVPRAVLLAAARERFGVELAPDNVHVAHLQGRRWVDAATWPRFTLLGQSLGSVLLGWEALCQFRPDIFVDSMGYAFTMPLFALVAGCRVGSYTHYPTISTDMLAKVKARDVAVCNDAFVARSQALSFAKLLYYHLFAWFYGLAGRRAEVVMVNSSWTRGHIDSLWRVPQRTVTVFPPCDTRALAALPLERRRAPGSPEGQLALSLAQFRPEKDHPLQLRALARFYELAPEHRAAGPRRVRLVLAGGCRGAGDEARVEVLRALCAELGLCDGTDVAAAAASQGSSARNSGDYDVLFRTNLPMEEMHALLGEASVGLHTMCEEHFGISVVEFMAAGAVPLAHRSGGPLLDIVTPLQGGPRTGYLATDAESYAEALRDIFSLSHEERLTIARAAREAVRGRFAEEAFEEAIASRLIAPLRGGG